MSKKTYQAVATAIYLASRPTCKSCGRGFVVLSGEAFGCPVHGIVEGERPKAEAIVGEIIAGLASTFKADNSAFNYGLFREACETGKCRGMRQVQGS
jgi:hypothetical protein